MDASHDAMGGECLLPKATPKGRDYSLQPRPARKAAKARLVPPRPGKGERQPVPYSKADRDALRATCCAFEPLAMVTLKAPPCAPLATWPGLRAVLLKLKSFLTNAKGRKGFPAVLCVTEFDPLDREGQSVDVTTFHMGFAHPLSLSQQEWFQRWWLSQIGMGKNQGRYFQHDARGGGQNLKDYLAKDVTFRDRQRRPVKFRPSWLPERLDCRLWFCVGIKRRPASEGRRLRARTGKVLRTFESAHAKGAHNKSKASTESHESAHAKPLLTSDPNEGTTTSSESSCTGENHSSTVHPGCIDSYATIDLPIGSDGPHKAGVDGSPLLQSPMNTIVSIIVSFPPEVATRLALDTVQGRMKTFGRLSDGLVDAGAKSVNWGEAEENVHTPVPVRCGPDAKDQHAPAAQPHAIESAAQPVAKDAERTAIDCLVTAGHALEKKGLIGLMNERGIGLNAARTAIARLETCRTVGEFTVQRDGKKSSVFVALLG